MLTQRLDHARVELAPSVLPQLGDRLPDRARSAVATIGDDRVVGVARGDDPRSQWDRLAREPVRIALSIPSLVARADQPGDYPQRRRHGQDALADGRVLSPATALPFAERAGLVQKLVGDGELAEVVKLGRPAQLVELF